MSKKDYLPGDPWSKRSRDANFEMIFSNKAEQDVVSPVSSIAPHFGNFSFAGIHLSVFVIKTESSLKFKLKLQIYKNGSCRNDHILSSRWHHMCHVVTRFWIWRPQLCFQTQSNIYWLLLWFICMSFTRALFIFLSFAVSCILIDGKKRAITSGKHKYNHKSTNTSDFVTCDMVTLKKHFWQMENH